MYSNIAANKRKTVFLMIVLILILGGLAFIVHLLTNTVLITATFGIVLLLAVTIQYVSGNKVLKKMVHGEETNKASHPTLYRIVENLAIRTGIPTPTIIVVNNSTPNAFASGTSPEKAMVGVTTGLLELLNDDELEGVMAHEIAHIKNYDTRVSLLVYAVSVTLLVLGEILIRAGFGNRNGLIFGLIGLAVLIIGYPLVYLIRMAVSREREYLADASSVEYTRYPEGLTSALQKIGNSPAKSLEPSADHMMFFNKSPKFLASILATHPPIELRVKRLKDSFKSF